MRKRTTRNSGNGKRGRTERLGLPRGPSATQAEAGAPPMPSLDAALLARLQEILRASSTGIPLADDLIWSARAIGFEIWGKDDAKHQRKIFHLFATSRTPIVKIGSTYVVRRSTLRRWIAQMEQEGLSGRRGIPPILSLDKDPPPTSRPPSPPTSGNKTPPAGDQERPHE